MAHHWGYAKENGPNTWEHEFPVAAGSAQSPIDIRKSMCLDDESLEPIVVDYNRVEVGELTNSGHSWQAKITSGKSSLTGGPLNSRFALEQFHAHWGSSDGSGSEHTLNGKSYSAELHLVHWDTDNFSSFSEAAAVKGGLTVLGIFLKVGEENHELAKLTKLMAFIPYQNQTVNIKEKIHCAKFLPHHRSYYTYEGSLTTPPCSECVNWIVFDEPIEISSQQLAAFRTLKSYSKSTSCPDDELHGCMVDNFRPCCPVNDREVRVYRDQSSREE